MKVLREENSSNHQIYNFLSDVDFGERGGGGLVLKMGFCILGHIWCHNNFKVKHVNLSEIRYLKVKVICKSYQPIPFINLEVIWSW